MAGPQDPPGTDQDRKDARSGDPTPAPDTAGVHGKTDEDSSSGFTVPPVEGLLLPAEPGVDVSNPTRRFGPQELPPQANTPPPLLNPVKNASAPPPADHYLGRTLAGRFRVLEQLGRGGMGFVYKAEQMPLGRHVALKVMNPNYATTRDPEYEQRFTLEAAVAARITHPNVITVYDYGKDDDTFFIAMELLQGRTLSKALLEDGIFSVERAVHVASQVAKGVREAHRNGAIHRDLKPANVMLVDHNDDHDFVKVLDFGLVKIFKQEESPDLTMTGIFLGSPKYMSPEQIRNQQPDPRADIYSLGIILFQMITGKVPFVHEQSVNVMLMHLSDPVPRPSTVAPQKNIPAIMDDLVLRCVEKEREKRFASMDELLVALRAVKAEVTGSNSSSTSAISVTPAQVAQAVAASSSRNGVSSSGRQPAISGKAMAVAVGVSALAAVGAIGLLTVLTAEKPVLQPPPAPPPIAVVVPVPPPPPVAPAARPLMVTSDPGGARVRFKDRDLGTTPLLTDLPATDGDVIHLELRLDGHEPAVVDVMLQDGRFKTSARLAPAKVAPVTPVAPVAPSKPDKKPKPRKKPHADFKDDPY